MAGAEKSPLRNIQNRWQGKMKEQHIFSKNSTYQLIEVLKTTEKYTEQVAGKNEGAAYFQQKQHISAD